MIGEAISPNARIGTGNTFGRGVRVDDDVVIGDNNTFGDFAVISGKTEIGDGNYIGDFTSVGRLPTNSNYRHEFEDGPESYERFGRIVIGSGNVIREYTNVNLPSAELTSIGNECYLMPHCHISHDAYLEDRVIMSNHTSPGGHTKILKGANLGKGTQVHQRTVIGQYAMIGIGSVVIRSVLPGATIAGNPARFIGVNRVGMKRNGFSEDDCESLASVVGVGKDVDLSTDGMTPKARETVEHFQHMLSTFGRDSRTVPTLR